MELDSAIPVKVEINQKTKSKPAKLAGYRELYRPITDAKLPLLKHCFTIVNDGVVNLRQTLPCVCAHADPESVCVGARRSE